MQLRKEQGWSQDELGKKVGVRQRYVSTWETGQNVPQTESLIKLAQVFEVSVDYLLFDNVPRQGTNKIDDFELYEFFRKAESLPQDAKNAVKKIVSALLFEYKVDQAKEEAENEKVPPAASLRKIAGKR